MREPQIVNLLFTLTLFAALIVTSFFSPATNTAIFLVRLLWSLIVSCFGFLIYRSRKIYPYRAALFILVAFFFFIEFKFFRFLKLPVMEAPYCHIALAPTIFNFFHAQFLALTSGNWHVWGFLTLGFLWLFLIFTIGQGICSWVCFYGGIDEAFSKILPQPLIKLKISKKWRDFPLAFLAFLLVISVFHGAAIFCSWFCPLKMTPSFGDNLILPRVIQILFFIFILGFLLILLPILTKKRTFCGFICPFGALAGICGNVSPYRVTIDKERCTLCKKCYEVCPVLAIDSEDLVKNKKISSYCNRCGKCIDTCPTQAIAISILGKKDKGPLVRNIFIFVALLLTGVISGSFVPQAILGLIEGLRWFR